MPLHQKEVLQKQLNTVIMSKIFTRLSSVDIFNITNIKISVAYGNVFDYRFVGSRERLKIINTIWKVDGVKKYSMKLRSEMDYQYLRGLKT